MSADRDALGRPLADRVMKARRESACPACGAPVRIGQRIAHCGDAWVHLACAIKDQPGHAVNIPERESPDLP
jgi:hypothetical protein